MQKITCWMYNGTQNDVVMLVGVNAASQMAAVAALRLGGFSVVDPAHVKQVTILEGVEHFPAAEEYAWHDEHEVPT